MKTAQTAVTMLAMVLRVPLSMIPPLFLVGKSILLKLAVLNDHHMETRIVGTKMDQIFSSYPFRI